MPVFYFLFWIHVSSRNKKILKFSISDVHVNVQVFRQQQEENSAEFMYIFILNFQCHVFFSFIKTCKVAYTCQVKYMHIHTGKVSCAELYTCLYFFSLLSCFRHVDHKRCKFPYGF